MEPAEEPVSQCRALMRQQVERIAHEVAIQHRNGSRTGTLTEMRQSDEMSLLALIQRQRAGGVDQDLSLRPQHGVVRDRENPGFPQMRHREIGFGLTSLVEQPNGVAVYEIERPCCFVIGGGGCGCRAG